MGNFSSASAPDLGTANTHYDRYYPQTKSTFGSFKDPKNYRKSTLIYRFSSFSGKSESNKQLMPSRHHRDQLI